MEPEVCGNEEAVQFLVSEIEACDRAVAAVSISLRVSDGSLSLEAEINEERDPRQRARYSAEAVRLGWLEIVRCIAGAASRVNTVGSLGDSNGDGVVDACQDADVDLVPDPVDNCVSVPNSGQQDSDADGFGDSCDPTIRVSEPKSSSDDLEVMRDSPSANPTFSADTPGLLRIDVAGTLGRGYIPASDSVEVCIEAVGESMPQWAVPTDDPLCGSIEPRELQNEPGRFSFRTDVEFRGLPSSLNDLGTKHINVWVLRDGRPVAEFPQEGMNESLTVDVKFPIFNDPTLRPENYSNWADDSFAKNHPGEDQTIGVSICRQDDFSSARMPNWMYYWLQLREEQAGNYLDIILPWYLRRAPVLQIVQPDRMGNAIALVSDCWGHAEYRFGDVALATTAALAKGGLPFGHGAQALHLRAYHESVHVVQMLTWTQQAFGNVRSYLDIRDDSDWTFVCDRHGEGWNHYIDWDRSLNPGYTHGAWIDLNLNGIVDSVVGEDELMYDIYGEVLDQPGLDIDLDGLLDKTFDERNGELVDLDFDCVPVWADLNPQDKSVDSEHLADDLEQAAVANDWFIGLQPYPNAR